jgi:hypothetical protein
MKPLLTKALSFGIKLEILQLTFALGAVGGLVAGFIICASAMVSVFLSAKALVFVVMGL